MTYRINNLNKCAFKQEVEKARRIGARTLEWMYPGWGFLYIISPNNQISKIGISRENPYKRLSSLQTGCWLSLELKWITYEININAMESAIHRLFKDYRLKGEWFDVPPDEIRHWTQNRNSGFDWVNPEYEDYIEHRLSMINDEFKRIQSIQKKRAA